VQPAQQRKKYCSFLTGRIDLSEEILKLTEDNEKFTTGDGQTNVTDLVTYGGTMSIVLGGTIWAESGQEMGIGFVEVAGITALSQIVKKVCSTQDAQNWVESVFHTRQRKLLRDWDGRPYFTGEPYISFH
jgi:hypothetical protein